MTQACKLALVSGLQDSINNLGKSMSTLNEQVGNLSVQVTSLQASRSSRSQMPKAVQTTEQERQGSGRSSRHGQSSPERLPSYKEQPRSDGTESRQRQHPTEHTKELLRSDSGRETAQRQHSTRRNTEQTDAVNYPTPKSGIRNYEKIAIFNF